MIGISPKWKTGKISNKHPLYLYHVKKEKKKRKSFFLNYRKIHNVFLKKFTMLRKGKAFFASIPTALGS